MKNVLLLSTLLASALASPAGFYYQESSIRSLSSSDNNNELQHQTEDESHFPKQGNIEGQVDHSSSQTSEQAGQGSRAHTKIYRPYQEPFPLSVMPSLIAASPHHTQEQTNNLENLKRNKRAGPVAVLATGVSIVGAVSSGVALVDSYKSDGAAKTLVDNVIIEPMRKQGESAIIRGQGWRDITSGKDPNTARAAQKVADTAQKVADTAFVQPMQNYGRAMSMVGQGWLDITRGNFK